MKKIKLDIWKANMCDGGSIIIYFDKENKMYIIKSPRHNDVEITTEELVNQKGSEKWTHDWTKLFLNKSDEGNYYDNDRITEIIEKHFNEVYMKNRTLKQFLYHKINLL